MGTRALTAARGHADPSADPIGDILQPRGQTAFLAPDEPLARRSFCAGARRGPVRLRVRGVNRQRLDFSAFAGQFDDPRRRLARSAVATPNRDPALPARVIYVWVAV